jgi:RNA polymerase sigma factor (sigma-70 family)
MVDGKTTSAVRTDVFDSAVETAAGTPFPTSRSAARNVSRFEILVLPHLDAAFSLARFLACNSESAEDIVQEALLRAFRSIETFRGVEARAWLLTIVRNCFYTWARENRSRLGTVPLGNTDEEWATAREDNAVTGGMSLANLQDTPERTLLRKSEGTAVRAVIESLPEQFRETLVLREIEELSYREIAEVTGAPIGTVMSRLARAREMFATAWQREYGDVDASTAAAPARVVR